MLEALTLCVAVPLALAACKQDAAASAELEAQPAAEAVSSKAPGVRKFDRIVNPFKAVSLTFATKVARSYTEVVQLVGP